MNQQEFINSVKAEAEEMLRVRKFEWHDKTEGSLRIVIGPSWLAGASVERFWQRVLDTDSPSDEMIAGWVSWQTPYTDDIEECIYRLAKLRAANDWEALHPRVG